ncbi:MAG: hypothetical protein Q8O12_03410 [Candidatus Omnitrophota bacterium]|nr:hypothetical protein [Candidatus Omnitrophota bacterium]
MFSNKPYLKIISTTVFLIFLLTNVYPSCALALRPNLMGDKGKEGLRWKIAVQEVAKFSIHNYRPGWTFKGWVVSKKAIIDNFRIFHGGWREKEGASITAQDRKEALKLVRILARKLAENRIETYSTLTYAIPDIALRALNIDEFKLLIGIGIELAKRGENPSEILQFCSNIVWLVRGINEPELFADLVIEAVANHDIDQIDSVDKIRYYLPKVGIITDNEAKKLFMILGIELFRNKANPSGLEPSIIYEASARNIEVLRKFIDMGINLAKHGEEPWELLMQTIPDEYEVLPNDNARRLFIDLGIELSREGVKPDVALYAFSEASLLTRDQKKLQSIYNELLKLNIKLSQEGVKLEPWHLRESMANLTKVAITANSDEIRKELYAEFEKAVIKLSVTDEGLYGLSALQEIPPIITDIKEKVQYVTNALRNAL